VVVTLIAPLECLHHLLLKHLLLIYDGVLAALALFRLKYLALGYVGTLLVGGPIPIVKRVNSRIRPRSPHPRHLELALALIWRFHRVA
jgi:hypothetical protein